jgi:hypothetical protein
VAKFQSVTISHLSLWLKPTINKVCKTTKSLNLTIYLTISHVQLFNNIFIYI